MTKKEWLERAREYEGQAIVLMEMAGLAQKELLAEAANYITLATFIRRHYSLPEVVLK